jgi:hypothetical protein
VEKGADLGEHRKSGQGRKGRDRGVGVNWLCEGGWVVVVLVVGVVYRLLHEKQEPQEYTSKTLFYRGFIMAGPIPEI